MLLVERRATEQLRESRPTVIVGPILAIFLSYVFGAALGSRVALGRSLTRHEHRTVFAQECRFLVISLPPLVILVILTIAGVVIHADHPGDRPGERSLPRRLGAG